MRRILFFLLTVCCALGITAGSHTYSNSSVLSSGKWVKLKVAQSGIYRMSYEDLRDAGLSNPAEVRIYGYGGAMLTQNFAKAHIDDLPSVAFYMNTGKDETFGPGDYILFYAQGPVGWQYNGQYFTHTQNTYSEYGYYFISDNAGVQTIMSTATPVDTTDATHVTSYWNCQVHEKELVNMVDLAGEEGGGREFYGEFFSNVENSHAFQFSAANPDTLQSTIVRVAVATAKASNTSRFDVLMNNKKQTLRVDSIPITDNFTKAQTAQSIYSFPTAASNTQSIELRFSSIGSSPVGYLNYLEVSTPCQLRMADDEIRIFPSEGYGSPLPVRYELKDAKAETQVWNITNLDNIQRVATQLDETTMSFGGVNTRTMQQYVALNPSSTNFLKPQVVGTIGNQNLHGLVNIDYVIICPAEFVEMATDLAKKHEEVQSITWAVVTDEQVYNEFSSGTPDATAYRWLMKMLYDRAQGANQKPRWLLLMGDGTFDNRKLLPASGQNTLLTYQSVNSTVETSAYATDDYFGWLDDNEGESDVNAKMDIGVGRLPVNTTTEARQVVDKLIAYMNNDKLGKWKQQLLFLADDGDHGQHTLTAEAGAERVRLRNLDFVVNKLYLDAYPQEMNASGESYPLAKNRLDNMLANGMLFLDYSGHGGYNNITNESMLGIKDISKMANDKQAFWLFATCNFAHFDAGKESAAETAVLNPHGGAIGVLSACRTVYATQNTMLNRNICDTLFGHTDVFSYDITLGEAVAIGKNRTTNDINKLSFILLGDPALRLNYPTQYQVETTTAIDTLHALDVQTVEGQIIDEERKVVDGFSGKVDITIYDKMQQLTTRDNDATGDDKKILTYNSYPNTLFSGSVPVKDGRFSYTFMLPKDIRYNYGNGRIVYYANDSLGEEAVGHYHDLVVGGSGSIYANDTTGPQIQLYLNTPAFVDGGTTYATPRFFADIYDEHGINTVGSGIGHDLMLVIDNSATMTYSLNDYFTSSNNSYQSGQVSYRLEELEDGPHTLSFRAWDLLNNSSTEHLNFVVSHDSDPSIYSVITYPNPVEAAGIVNMTVQYDQPDVAITSEYYLYDISGQMVWSKQANNPETIQVNLGQLGLKPGVYIYNVRIKSAESRYSTSSGKIIVTK